MEFNWEGLEEFFTDGVLNPATTSEAYLKNCTKYKNLGSRVFVLYEPDSKAFPNGADFDIVLLHGIGSDEFKCWTNAQGIVWPAVFFPQDFPTARVLTVGYAHSLFNWRSGTCEAAETSTKPLSAVSLDSPTNKAAETSQLSSGTARLGEQEGGAFKKIALLADRVEQTVKESVSSYVPKEISKWWKGTTEPQRCNKERLHHSSSKTTSNTASSKQKDGNAPTKNRSSQHTENPLFQLLTGIRDSAGSLVAAEHEGSSGNLYRSSSEVDEAAETKRKNASRDIQSLQNMRIVAAELAERLSNVEIGVGRRPVIFLVHSMGGLILKQMLVSLFEAARLAPPSAAALSRAAMPKSTGQTLQEAAVNQNCAAVHKANFLLGAVRGVVFYGTPHFGSAVASVITGLQKYYQGFGGLTPTSVVSGLGDHNKRELMRLNDRFLDVVERLGDELAAEIIGPAGPASQSNAKTECYMAAMKASLALISSAWGVPFDSAASIVERNNDGGGSRGTVWVMSFGETKKLNGLVRVVNPESSNPAPDDPRYPFYLVNADHGEICRPLTKMSPSYAMVYGLLDRMQQRGMLKWQHEPTTSMPLLTGLSSSAYPEPTKGDTHTSVIGKLSETYESGWSDLFDPARFTGCASGNTRTASPSQPLTTSAHTSGTAANQRCLLAYQQGLGEMRLALPVLEAAVADLHQLLHRFFGVAIPPQLDSIFLLTADVTDFVRRFYRREALALQMSAAETQMSEEEKGNVPSIANEVLVDEIVSFRVPVKVLTYWVEQAIDLLRVFEVSQQERANGVDVVGGTSPTAARWESNLLHPGSRDLRELSELEQSIRVVQEEWEVFRRYVSLRIRSSSNSSASGSPQRDERREQKRDNKTPHKVFIEYDQPVDPSAREHIAVLFFARAIRTIASQHLHDGGALGRLLGEYLRSATLQVHGSEKLLSSAHFEQNPWTLIEYSGSTNAKSFVSFAMEVLELSLTPFPGLEGGGMLTDTVGSRVELSTDAELRAIVPALTAASSVLLGCFALFVDNMHPLDGDARWPRAARHFQLAASALTADFQVRGRLLRAASRTMQGEGLDTFPPRNDGANAHGSDKKWWKASRNLTTPKEELTTAAGTPATRVVAAVFTDSRQAHVAKLDDGLFLSAMQLVTESFRCSVLTRICHARCTQRDKPQTCLRTNGRGRPASETDEHSTQSEENTEEEAFATDSPLDDLVRSVEAAQRVYLRTNQILRGVFALNDMEEPFALPLDHGAGEEKKDIKVKSVMQPEKRVRDRLRDAIQSILSELDNDESEANEGENRGTEIQAGSKAFSKKRASGAQQAPSRTSHTCCAKKKNRKDPNELKATPALPTTASTTTAAYGAVVSAGKKSRKDSLAMLIVNSLSKAWEAVRSGVTAAETPEHLAFTAMVMWWTVEWGAAAVIKDIVPALLDKDPSRTTSLPHAAKLKCLLDTIEVTQRRRIQVTGNTQNEALKATVNTSDSKAAVTPREKEENKWEAQCWSSANPAVRCKWITLCGSEDFLRRLHSELHAERKMLDRILTSRSVNKLRDMQGTFVPPAALTQLDGEGGTRLGIPASLLDAVQHDDTNAALWCWLGHCYATRCMRSSDTAQAYVQVIRNEYAARKENTPTAEVGLAWSHVHSVPCSFSQLWRASLGAHLFDAREESSNAYSDAYRRSSGICLRTVASLLDFGSTGVIDTSALYSVPPSLEQFCREAVIHHANAVEAYAKSQQTASPLSKRTDAVVQSLSLLRPSAHGGALRHLRFAEEGFQRALRADPANIGALCGLGRLRCLSVSPSSFNHSVDYACEAGAGDTVSTLTFLHDAAKTAGRGGGVVSSTDSACFFAAALDVAARRRSSAGSNSAGLRASPESCAHAMDDVWLSYAAYWMSEETRRARVTGGSCCSKTPPNYGDVASSDSAAWLLKSLQHYPRNDWALTSLGLCYLQSSSQMQLSRGPGGNEKENSTQIAVNSRGVEEVFKLRGLALLQRALTINPTNMWALWGIGTYGTSMPHRTTCQQLLRSWILKNIPKL